MNNNEYLKLLYRTILDVLCVSEDELKSVKKKANIVDARKIFSYLCKEQGLSLNQIGALVNRNHSTIAYQVDTFTEFIKFDKVLRDKFFKVKLYIDNKLKGSNV